LTTHCPPLPHAPAAPERRIHHSLTASAEKRALEFLARHSPSWLTSDQLTALGLFGQLAAGLTYALSRRHRDWLLLCCVMLAINWLGDSLDGTLARVRLRQRPRYGFYLDHVCDLFGSIALMAGIALSGLAHGWVCAALLAGFLLLAGESFLATHTVGHFQLSQGPFGPTELRLLMIAGNITAWVHPRVMVFGHRVLLYDLGGIIGCLFMFAAAILTASRHATQLARLDPLRAPLP
jgi:phosphatidylglycerophosphate synthase